MPNTSKHDEPIAPRHQKSTSGSQINSSALASLLNEWMNGDEREQRETFETLRRLLDEDRPAGYKLFS
ncbi:MAG TPA: hypothetical protein VGF59_16555 [Bryobacteraceae bacterium]|jgi:hypothetical protein